MNIESLKLDLSIKTKRGITYIVSGLLFWTIMGILGLVIPDSPKKALIYLYGSGTVFPIGMAIAYSFKQEVFIKNNPLSSLGGIIGGLQILFFPILIGAFFISPKAIPWYLATLVGAHFLPFSWLYNSRAYLFSSIITPIVAGLTGWFFHDKTFVITPFAIATVFLITIILLTQEINKDRNIIINSNTKSL